MIDDGIEVLGHQGSKGFVLFCQQGFGTFGDEGVVQRARGLTKEPNEILAVDVI